MYLVRRHTTRLHAARSEFYDKFVCGFDLLRMNIFSSMGQSKVLHCTAGEFHYIGYLVYILDERIDTCRGENSIFGSKHVSIQSVGVG